MWPDSGFAHPVSSYERPVPLVLVDPCDNPDVAILVRHEWIPYIIGSLKQLVLQTTWDTSDADALWLVQQRAMSLLSCVATSQKPVDCVPPVAEMDYEMAICEQLRVQDGKLQALCCGEWSDIAGQPAQGIGGPGQPGSGAEQPSAGGGQACYQGQMPATGSWLVPTVVNAGDQVELTDAKGAGQDGTVSPWYCPNGQTFFAGACIGIAGVSGSDPLPTANHMSLLFKIGGTYYSAMSGPVTVPGGVANANVEVVINDSALGDNSGSYTFGVCVTNNAPEAWSHCWLGGKGAIGMQLPPQTQIWGSYDFSTDRVLSQDSGAGTAENASVDIPYVGTATHIEFDVIYDNDGPLGSAGTGIASDANNPGVQNVYSVLTPVGAGTLHVSWTGSFSFTQRIRLFASSIKTTVGTTIITNVKVNGAGASPFGADNC